MNRIDRLTAILIQLQSKPIVKAKEIADRFDISLRTVYRDIRALEEAGINFIGPSAAAIQTMGDKISAKQAVGSFGVPLVPGMDKPIEDVAEARKIAKDIGYPVLVKASAGGGGKGMRIVHNDEDFEGEMERAMSEALSAFGNGAVFVEKFISAPKHIEVQIIGDKFREVRDAIEQKLTDWLATVPATGHAGASPSVEGPA